MPNPDIEAERRDFEAVERQNHPKTGPSPEPDLGRTKADGTYYIVAREFRWQGWLARAALPVKVSECTTCHCYEKARAFAGNPMEGVTFQLTPPNCGACGKPMTLSMWDRPNGPPGNGYVCLYCKPTALENDHG